MATNITAETILIVPCFEDSASSQFCEEVANEYGKDITLIVVDDGSVQRPFDSHSIANNGLTGKLIRLNRNVGHQAAIATGIAYACENMSFDTLVIMDSDGEDKPQDISKLIQGLDEGHNSVDIIVAKRTSRHESLKFKAFYFIYKLLFQILTGRKIAFGNFMAMKKSAAERLVTLSEIRIHLAATTLKSKLRVSNIPIARGKRYKGKSLMNLVSLTLHGISSITVFSEQVLARMTLFCALSAASILLVLITLIILKLAGLTVIGWFSTISSILLLMLFQIGIMTLLVLLLSGSLRASSVGQIDYNEFIKEVINVE